MEEGETEMPNSTEARLQHINSLTIELHEVEQRMNDYFEIGRKTGKLEDPVWKTQLQTQKDKVTELQRDINRAHSELSTASKDAS